MKNPLKRRGRVYSALEFCVNQEQIFASDRGLCMPRVYIQVEKEKKDQGNPGPTADV